MKQLFITLIAFYLLVLPSYATATECDYTMTDKEIETELDNILAGGIYKDKTATGSYCATVKELLKLQFNMKNGKINGGIQTTLYYEKDKPMLETYISDYSVFYEDFYKMIGDDGLPDFTILQDKNLDITSKAYHENGKIWMNCAIKNGIGDCTSYTESGAMDIYRPIKNYRLNGTAEVYSENGRLWATLNYNNGNIISAECVNDRKNGKKWTKAEISNWENGLEVSCNYFE